MMFKRRNFLGILVSTTFYPSIFQPATVESSKYLIKNVSKTKGRFTQTVRCTFPNSMSFASFTELSRQWTRPDDIPLLDKEYHQNGEILSVTETVGTGYVEWQYSFKNKDSFNSWSRETHLRQLFDAGKVSHLVEYSFFYSELEENKSEHASYFSNKPLCRGTLDKCRQTEWQQLANGSYIKHLIERVTHRFS